MSLESRANRSSSGSLGPGAAASREEDAHQDVPLVAASRKARVLFINDTARNGGPGRSLFYILRFLDPAVVHRSVVLPRPGVISELYASRGVTEDLLFEPDLVENPIEPSDRPMSREDFEAPIALQGARAAFNVVRAVRAMARLRALLKRGAYDLVYCNGTNADFAGGLLAKIANVPVLWHVRYTSLPKAVRGLHDRLAAGPGVGVSSASPRLRQASFRTARRRCGSFTTHSIRRSSTPLESSRA